MRAVNFAAAALIAVPLGALAQNQGTTTSSQRLPEGQTSASCIKHITFSQEFLASYPNAGAACREVKVENGVKWARFDADVVRVSGNQVTANFVDTSNRNLSAITFEATPDSRVEVNGRPIRFQALRGGDRLSVWMPESRVGFYAEPGTSESDKLTVISHTPAQR
jgi:hypothetical protein